MFLNYNSEKLIEIIEDIELDLERTFLENEYFLKLETKQSIKRILIAYSNFEK